MEPQKPSIGRIVHFVGLLGLERDKHYPAIVTHVFSDTCVNLEVGRKGTSFDDKDAGLRTSVVLDEKAEAAYTWHWPEREA